MKRETLAATPARAFKLLHGIGIRRPIRAALEQRGFTASDRRQGWMLLEASSAYRAPAMSPPSDFDASIRSANAELAAWSGDGFRILRATLERRFPAQAARVLEGLAPANVTTAVLVVATLLERLDALSESYDETDRAAMALLAERGITREERRKLEAYVAIAQSGGKVSAKSLLPPSDVMEKEEKEDAAQAKALRELRAWFEEWAAIAKSVIKRRDLLIVIGLAEKRGRRNGAKA